jgi:formylglycine-generating enzyme required for sulfatase activity
MRKKYLILVVGAVIVLLGMGLAVLFMMSGPDQPSPLETRALQIRGVNLEMVYIPPGEFLMGSADGWIDERPVHRVRITRGFWMGRTEVTQGLWTAVMKSNPSGFSRGNDYPVERVSWDECREFCRKLKELSGISFRLPSEAEWEYACRAGDQEDFPRDLDEWAWHKSNSNQSTHPVALKQANAFGLFDMLGNVWEWCEDRYGKFYYSRSPDKDPRGPVTGTHRVDRGGGWAYGPDIVRPSRRDGSGPNYKTNLIGFRLAAD